jgi:hypothetical protein
MGKYTVTAMTMVPLKIELTVDAKSPVDAAKKLLEASDQVPEGSYVSSWDSVLWLDQDWEGESEVLWGEASARLRKRKPNAHQSPKSLSAVSFAKIVA